MKKNLIHLLFVFPLLMFIFSSLEVSAHNQEQSSDRRDKWATAQARQIAEELHLTADQTERFITDYLECQHNIWNLDTPNTSRKHNSKNIKSDKEAEKVLKARFEKRRKMNDILEKYYKKYSSYLTQSQILKLYEVERFLMDKNMRDKGAHKKSHQHHR